MTFNTPGYVIQNGWIKSGANGLTVTTNVDATMNASLDAAGLTGDFLIKNGPRRWQSMAPISLAQ